LAEPYDFGRLEVKADAGADFAQTQIVFDVDAFEAWAEEAQARGLFERLFLLAGVAVPRSAASARYMRDHLHGVRVPDAVIDALDEAGPDAEDVGVGLTVEVVNRLRAIPGIAGIHLMGLGRLEPVRRVVEAAGLFPRPSPT
jgi:methylenetetrahydrofolate reductase (NADPH)